MTRHIMLLLKIYYNCVDNLKSQNSVIFNIKFSFILALIMNLSFGFQEKKGGKKKVIWTLDMMRRKSKNLSKYMTKQN